MPTKHQTPALHSTKPDASLSPEQVLSETHLATLGLVVTDVAEVNSLAATLDVSHRETLLTFGREIAQHTAEYTDTMLDQVRATDLDVLGAKLTGIVTTAQSLNLHALSGSRSRVPLVGGLIDKLRLGKDEFMQRFKTVKAQIDGLVDEIDQMQRGLTERIESLGNNFTSVKQEHRMLGLHIAAGQVAISKIRQDIDLMQAQAEIGQLAGMRVQDLQDSSAAVATLDKRIADLRMLQHSALQTLPMIRMVQSNSSMLIEKFHTVKELTLPAWKRQFMLSLSLNEQRNAVQLAESIDNATNEFLRENATLLQQNTVSTAKANQRLVIDVETLQQVQDTLLATVQEVIKINAEGIVQRRGVSEQLSGMRAQLQSNLAKLL